MARKARYVVRIVTHPTEMDTESTAASRPGHTLGEFVECLRYAGVLRIHRQDGQGMCLDILPPEGVDSGTWADLNAARMESFGWNAVKAPEMPRTFPAAACPRCGGWTASGGMSQHASGPEGCRCNRGECPKHSRPYDRHGYCAGCTTDAVLAGGK